MSSKISLLRLCCELKNSRCQLPSWWCTSGNVTPSKTFLIPITTWFIHWSAKIISKTCPAFSSPLTWPVKSSGGGSKPTQLSASHGPGCRREWTLRRRSRTLDMVAMRLIMATSWIRVVGWNVASPDKDMGEKWQGSGQRHRDTGQAARAGETEGSRGWGKGRSGVAKGQWRAPESSRLGRDTVSFYTPNPSQICPWAGDHWSGISSLCSPLVETFSRPGQRSPSTVSPTDWLMAGAARQSLPREEDSPLLAGPCKWHWCTPPPSCLWRPGLRLSCMLQFMLFVCLSKFLLQLIAILYFHMEWYLIHLELAVRWVEAQSHHLSWNNSTFIGTEESEQLAKGKHPTKPTCVKQFINLISLLYNLASKI